MKKKLSQILLLIVITSTFLNSQNNIAFKDFVKQHKATGFVNDFAFVLSKNEKQNLEKRITEISDSSSIQFGICIIEKLDNIDIQEFAQAIGNYWGVGHKDKNNGTIILLVVYDRKVFISTGIGTEKIVTDSYLKELIDNDLIPLFKANKNAVAFNFAVEKIYNMQKFSELDIRKKKSSFNLLLFGFLVFIAIALFLYFLFFPKSKKEEEIEEQENFDGFGTGKFREGSGAGGNW